MSTDGVQEREWKLKKAKDNRKMKTYTHIVKCSIT